MSYEAERISLLSRFDNEWGEITPIETATSKALTEAQKQGVWVRFTILNGESNQVSYGDTLGYHYPGVISVQIFIPEGIVDTNLTNKPINNATYLTDRILDIFQNKCFDDITCKATYIASAIKSDGYYQVNVNTPFYRRTHY